ncbi:MAG: DUF3465 domain-containing protein [Candidatus Eremiobacteraeota bacterium]|nr:DUF3465 domain-containing protein [Candidatus Eremiobacteraeota bacterium]
MTSTTRRNAALGLVLALAACAPAATSADAGNGAIYDAWRAGRSHVEVTASGTIARVLGTRPGRISAHEGFLLHLRGAAGRGLTVRVEDNVDFTGAIPLQPGADVVARGEYVYDSRGGIVHYTHRDPRGRHAAGYVETGGKLYQ